MDVKGIAGKTGLDLTNGCDGYLSVLSWMNLVSQQRGSSMSTEDFCGVASDGSCYDAIQFPLMEKSLVF